MEKCKSGLPVNSYNSNLSSNHDRLPELLINATSIFTAMQGHHGFNNFFQVLVLLLLQFLQYHWSRQYKNPLQVWWVTIISILCSIVNIIFYIPVITKKRSVLSSLLLLQIQQAKEEHSHVVTTLVTPVSCHVLTNNQDLLSHNLVQVRGTNINSKHTVFDTTKTP